MIRIMLQHTFTVYYQVQGERVAPCECQAEQAGKPAVAGQGP